LKNKRPGAIKTLYTVVFYALAVLPMEGAKEIRRKMPGPASGKCSLILPAPSTGKTAADFISISSALLRSILQSPVFVINKVLGRLRDSFELSVYVDGVKIDFYHVYGTENISFINAMRKDWRMQRIRWVYPRMSGQICTGEMHGRLFHLPCDFQKVIEVIKNNN
jgi:hypothetical protein